MNELVSTAIAAFDAKQNELSGKAISAEVGVFESTQAPTEKLRLLRVIYIDAYKELATYFLSEYRRVNEHSSITSMSDLDPWLEECLPRLKHFHSIGSHRHEIRSEPWSEDKLYLSACAELFDNIAADVSENFGRELAKAQAEFRSKSLTKRNDRIEKAVWAFVGFALGIAASLITPMLLHIFELAS